MWPSVALIVISPFIYSNSIDIITYKKKKITSEASSMVTVYWLLQMIKNIVK